MAEVETLKGACPVCGGDVAGSDEALFFCKRCNLLFSRRSLRS